LGSHLTDFDFRFLVSAFCARPETDNGPAAEDIRGPWRWVRSFKPDGQDSYDMTAWQDGQGVGYLARSVGNSFLGISRLNEHFNETAGICASSSQVRHSQWSFRRAILCLFE
jgi:hypothetical protein